MNPANLVFLMLMIAVFYLVLIRPQQRRARQHQQLMASVQPGDEVMTIGGMYGYVKSVDGSTMWLEVAHGTVVRMSRQAVSRKISPEVQHLEGAVEPEDGEGA